VQRKAEQAAEAERSCKAEQAAGEARARKPQSDDDWDTNKGRDE
jgi:hypothetical protein